MYLKSPLAKATRYVDILLHRMHQHREFQLSKKGETYRRRLLKYSKFPLILRLTGVGVWEQIHKFLRACGNDFAICAFGRRGHVTEADGVAARD